MEVLPNVELFKPILFGLQKKKIKKCRYTFLRNDIRNLVVTLNNNWSWISHIKGSSYYQKDVIIEIYYLPGHKSWYYFGSFFYLCYGLSWTLALIIFRHKLENVLIRTIQNIRHDDERISQTTIIGMLLTLFSTK